MRLLLVVPFAIATVRGADRVALAIFFFASVTDTLDGQLARRLGQRSKWGRLIDPLADKLLISVAFCALAFFRDTDVALPAWLAIAVIVRDIVILGGAAFYLLLPEKADSSPHGSEN